VNEKVQAAPPTALEEAPAEFRLGEPVERPEHPSLRLEELRGADLRGQDLTNIEGLLPEHLAGADLTGATLPEKIEKFPAVGQVAAISSEARKISIGLLAACFYSWLVIGTTKDVQLIVNTATSPLPIINTPIPIAGFYVVGAALLAAVYCYLHFYLQRLWRTLATLPAVFPDGTELDDRTDPWLLTNLVRADFARLRANAPPLTRLENLLAVVVAWWLVPITLLALWARYLPAHGWRGTSWLLFLIGLTTLFGRHTYRLARTALQGKASANAGEGDRDHGILARASHEVSGMRPDRLTVGLVVVLIVCPFSAFRDHPHNPAAWVARGLNFIGVRTYADLREAEVAQTPEDWDGKDWSRVKRVDLRGSNLAFADAASAFLTNADMRGVNLRDANLRFAQLQGAWLSEAQLQGADLVFAQLQDAYLDNAQLQGAHLVTAQLQGANLYNAQLQGAVLIAAELQGADLSGARLQGADLSGAQLQGANLYDAQLQDADLTNAELHGADLSGAQLQGADLTDAKLHGANLVTAQLQGADLSGAQLQGANLADAELHGADLAYAQLQGANLTEAQLQGADLSGARLQGADLQKTTIWRAKVYGAVWDLADLRGSTVQLMTNSEIDVLISEATEAIPDEGTRTAAAERLTRALRSEERSPRPEFPDEWQSKPNVMFSAGDPEFEPFRWGQPSWVTEEAYDTNLATLLGRLACAAYVPEAQTRGLATRALWDYERLYARRLTARLIGPDCPPAKSLPDDMRRRLQELAAPPEAAAAPETPSDPVE
jgi:uncharacterized protein YjbI with pentapeptide repeats